MIQAVVFDTNPYDREGLQRAAAGRGIELRFMEWRLSAETAATDHGAQAVCTFVSDRVDRPCLEALAALAGETYRPAQRCAGGAEAIVPHQRHADRHAGRAAPVRWVLVSVSGQTMHVCRNGILIGHSTVSTGSQGHATPGGVFSILVKKQEHYSKKYNNALMPNMQRLTCTGICMDSGNLPAPGTNVIITDQPVVRGGGNSPVLE
jgi:hypothetical protein